MLIHGFLANPLLKADRSHSWSQNAVEADLARIASAVSPRRTLTLKTVRVVGLARSPLTMTPLPTEMGTLAHRSTSSASGAAANAASISDATSARNSWRV